MQVQFKMFGKNAAVYKRTYCLHCGQISRPYFENDLHFITFIHLQFRISLKMCVLKVRIGRHFVDLGLGAAVLAITVARLSHFGNFP